MTLANGDALLNKRKHNNTNDTDKLLMQSKTLQELKERGTRHHKLVLFESTCKEIMFNDNPYLLTGYREETANSWSKCFASLVTLHNDTGNVWTHLIGAGWALYLIYDAIYNEPLRNLPSDDLLAFICFLGLTTICLFTSSIYHLFRTHSVEVYVVLLTCDIIGITFQVFGSTFLLVFFEMNCYTWWRNIYMVYLCILAIITAVYVPYLVRNRYAITVLNCAVTLNSFLFRKTSLRTFLLVCFALTGIVCWTHHFFLVGGQWNTYNTITLRHLLTTYAWVGAGLVIRRIRIPEYFAPGLFDVWVSRLN